MNHSPAFQFYAADFLSDENVVAMSLPARGAYITLICFCWREGSIPSDLNRLARLCGVDSSAMALLWQEVCLCFAPATNDEQRMIHPRLEREREKQVIHRKERSETGKRGAEQRWGKSQPQAEQEDRATKKAKPKGDGSAIAQPMAKPMANDGSSSSSSTSVNTPLPPKGDGGEFADAEPDSDDLDEALADIFPGQSLMSRKMLDASQCAMTLKATPTQIRAWPGWMTENWPKCGRTPLNFVDYFPQMLTEAKPNGNRGKPPGCPFNRCTGSGFIPRADGSGADQCECYETR